jgi:hypothetical protein
MAHAAREEVAWCEKDQKDEAFQALRALKEFPQKTTTAIKGAREKL